MSWHFTKFSLQRFRLDELENKGNYLVLGQVSPEDEGVSPVLILLQRVYFKSSKWKIWDKSFSYFTSRFPIKTPKCWMARWASDLLTSEQKQWKCKNVWAEVLQYFLLQLGDRVIDWIVIYKYLMNCGIFLFNWKYSANALLLLSGKVYKNCNLIEDWGDCQLFCNNYQ